MSIKESETVKSALVKQDCIVADASATCKLVLWEVVWKKVFHFLA